MKVVAEEAEDAAVAAAQGERRERPKGTQAVACATAGLEKFGTKQ